MSILGTCESSSTNEHMDGVMVCWLDAGHEGPHIDPDPVWGGRWDDAPDPKFTPAVERAAELLIREAETTGLITDDVRNGLAAALDVEEMARMMVEHQRIAPYSERQCMCGVTVSSKETGAQHVAAAIRAAILGGAA